MYLPIERPLRLPATIAQALASDIQDGRLKVGDKLPGEQKLAAAFGVSRNVVREAISQLRYDGLVEARQGAGAFVTSPEQRSAFRISPECFEKRRELRQILDLLAGVHATAASLAALKRSTADLARIRKCLAQMRKPMAEDPDALARRLDAEINFYNAIAAASGNSYVIDFILFLNRRVTERLGSVFQKNAKATEISSVVLEEHEAVFSAIVAQSQDEAREAARLHFEAASRRLARRGDRAE
jgi:GntR family transcriptional repressor for pyruvate dehydrogenase complex